MSLIHELERCQAEHGFLSEVSLRELSAHLGEPLYRLQEIVSFYPHFHTESQAEITIHVCRDASCHLSGGDGLADRLVESFAADAGVHVQEVSCLGCCELAPAVRVNGVPGRGDAAAALVASVRSGRIPEAEDETGMESDAPAAVSAAAAAEEGIRRSAGEGPWRCDPYPEAAGHYGALRAALAAEDPEGAATRLIEELTASRLRGMGGAGFPTGRKWGIVRSEAGTPKYVICNADESEPGTFKDRIILEQLPHLVIEGMILGGLVVGAETGIVYLRHEYGRGRRALEAELARVREEGLLGHDILGSGFDFQIEMFLSPGGYILGEETALLEALEDRRGEPRNKPPFPGKSGLHGRPTLINNVETFAFVPAIARRGSDWWRAQGSDGHPGLKFIAVSGHVERPGVYEIPLGTTVAQLIERAGGVSGGRTLKAFAPGGASSNFLPPERADTPIDFGSLADAGSMMGSGALMVVAEGTPLLPLAANIVRFFRNESCGKCVPCRDGTQKAVQLLDGAIEHGEPLDWSTIQKLQLLLSETSICGLGYVALNPLLSVAEHWPEEIPRRNGSER